MTTDSIEVFGSRLLDSQDLDPVYTGLHNLKMGDEQLRRWLVAYWCFYNVGVASYLSEVPSNQFWSHCTEAAFNIPGTSPVGDRWPRGAERRHFRGALATSAVRGLWERYPKGPEDLVDYVAAPGTFLGVSVRVQEHRGFGPWIGFKVADMVERVLGKPVEFDNASVFMFKDPTVAALRLWEEQYATSRPNATKEDKLKRVTDHLLGLFRHRLAPPSFDRPVNIQEIETILCKWKSYRNGHYPYGKDSQEVRHVALQWASVSPTAAAFARNV